MPLVQNGTFPELLAFTESKLPRRYDSTSGGEREIQRTMLELLNQLDGFDTRGDVKVIMATNKISTLDPALIRPGRIDRKIEFPLPDVKTKRHIFRYVSLWSLTLYALNWF
jgi:ATP-dependent 26S proteasome regulatory subunit